MKRKIIKQANSAYTMTLPIDWVRANKISGSSEVNVSVEGKSLVVSNEGVVEGKKVKIDVEGLDDRNISRQITALYARGVDEIKITSCKKVCSSKIINMLGNTLGYAIISHDEGEYVIRDMGGGNYSDLDEIFKRVFQMVISFYYSAIKDIFGKQEETIEGLWARDREINKFCLYLQRAVNKMSYPDPIMGRLLTTYSFELERIGDEIQRLWRTNLKYNVKKTDKLRKLAETSAEGLGRAFDFYYQFNPKVAEDIYVLREKVREDSLKLLGLDKHTVRFTRHIVKIIEDAADLSHLTLMMKLED
ncbi:phosphate uptake regulator PhoU [archaeon]|nr:phosphate uptake regulator PhoU [archaeon]MBT3577764.1 phosphate uptake regulator PhoU [archaeon]MBT6820771.1 phosphate uptake regulator PhoU [archaeon]MBT7025911.1 phosphate uptake regulator PhoU [archaeon]MBT7239186.1 phosphate uptake regulator PhoU [archaeon]